MAINIPSLKAGVEQKCDARLRCEKSDWREIPDRKNSLVTEDNPCLENLPSIVYLCLSPQLYEAVLTV